MPSIETVPKDESLGNEHFDKLFHDYRAMIYRVAYSILKRPEDAQDVLQSILTDAGFSASIPAPANQSACPEKASESGGNHGPATHKSGPPLQKMALLG